MRSNFACTQGVPQLTQTSLFAVLYLNIHSRASLTEEGVDDGASRNQAPEYWEAPSIDCSPKDEKKSAEAPPVDLSESAAIAEVPELKSATRTKKQKRKESWHFFTVCFAFFLAGWDGGSLGPLLPRIQMFYDVGPFIMQYFCLLTYLSPGKLHRSLNPFHHEMHSKRSP